MTDYKNEALRLLLSTHKDNVLVFEYDVNVISPEELQSFVDGVQELVDNKAIFIPKTMTVDSVKDVDFLIESYTNVVSFLEKLRGKVKHE